jgi:hypothetical protein
MDSTNIACIIGQFKKGKCQEASIFTLNSRIITNISV